MWKVVKRGNKQRGNGGIKPLWKKRERKEREKRSKHFIRRAWKTKKCEKIYQRRRGQRNRGIPMRQRL